MAVVALRNDANVGERQVLAMVGVRRVRCVRTHRAILAHPSAAAAAKNTVQIGNIGTAVAIRTF